MHCVDFSSLERELPPIVARSEVHKLTGGAVAVGTLANADCVGEGPKERFRIGKRICYRREALVDWLRERSAPVVSRGAAA